MKAVISSMLERYENGKISRRQLIQAIAGIAAAAQRAPAQASTFKGVEINHIALRVTDVPRSRDFYRKHFGLPVVRESSGSCFLGMGKNFLALFKSSNAGMDHYCLAVEGYRVDSATAELERQGLKPRREENRVYFPDPDGLTVQLSAVDHTP